MRLFGSEQLGKRSSKTHEVNILCAYPLSSFHEEEETRTFSKASVQNTQPFILSKTQFWVNPPQRHRLSSWRSSASGSSELGGATIQTDTSSGNTHTTGLSMFSVRENGMAMLRGELALLTDPHDLHGCLSPMGFDVLSGCSWRKIASALSRIL